MFESDGFYESVGWSLEFISRQERRLFGAQPRQSGLSGFPESSHRLTSWRIHPLCRPTKVYASLSESVAATVALAKASR
jgi:hypothetical protein